MTLEQEYRDDSVAFMETVRSIPAPQPLWQQLSRDEKVAAIEMVQADHPDWAYPKIAEHLGTTHAGIAGAVFRAGKAKPSRGAERPISKNVHAVVKTIFQTCKNMGMTEAELSRRSGYTLETLWALRQTTRGTRLQTVCDLAEVVGLELIARPVQ